MARTRGMLNDNTSGVLYANTNITVASTVNAIASFSATTKRISVEFQKPGFRVTTGSGLIAPITMFSSGVITELKFTYREKTSSRSPNPGVAGTKLNLMKVAYDANGNSAATIAQTLTVVGGASTTSNTLNIPFIPGDRFYFDITKVPTPPGTGLLITLTYFGN